MSQSYTQTDTQINRQTEADGGRTGGLYFP